MEEEEKEGTGRRRAAKTDWGKYGRKPVVLLALVALIDSVDRGILPGVLDAVQKDLGFNDFEAGLLGTVFVIAGFVVVLPAGYLADRHPRTRLIAIVLASWGVISALNAAVVGYWQFLAVRATLGAGETVNGPAAQSLIADYYRPTLRGRAYAFQRVAPIAGTAIGTGIGGVVGALFGWRWAFLVVGVPGSLLAFAVWRMPEPRRGEHDELVEPDLGVLATSLPEREELVAEAEQVEVRSTGVKALLHDARLVFGIPTLRYLMIGNAIAGGALAGIGFWAPAFFTRHTDLTAGQASGVVAVLLLSGALLGTWFGGVATDRLRGRSEGAPLVLAGLTQLIGACALMMVWLPTPLWVKLLFSVIGAVLLVAGFPALAAMTAEVVPAAIRGITFSVTGFATAILAAASPLVIGAIADQFTFVVNGKNRGNLATAFLIVTPLVMIGALVLLRGRGHVGDDRRRAADLAVTLAAERQ
ncbi:MAG: MFS transporter [Acidimicrobiia bacterium]